MALWSLARSSASTVKAGQQDDDASQDTPDRVTNPDRIASLFEQILEQRCLLAVSIAGVDDRYTSAVIEVVRAENYVVIDELAPRAVNRSLRAGLQLSMQCRMRNVTVCFESRIDAAGEEDGLAYYRLSIPQAVNLIQRREYFRAGVPMEKKVPVQLAMPNGTLYSAELRDVSLGGFSARLPGELPAEVRAGNNIQHVVITLPSLTRIRGSGLICYADLVQTSRVSRCGVRFLHVDRMDKHALEQFIAQLDREMKRKNLN